MAIKVSNQTEFDKALLTGETIEIVSNELFVISGSSNPTIETWDDSNPTIETYDSSEPTIKTWDDSNPTIETYGNSKPTIVTFNW